MEQILLIIIIFGMGFLCAVVFLKDDKKRKDRQEVFDKLLFYYQILNMWLEMKQKGRSAVTYLQEKGIKRIALYGMKELGERFYEEVKNTEVEVVCVIDKNPKDVVGDFWVISPEDKIPDVDAVVVTADYYYNEIRILLSTKVNCPIYSLNGVLGNSFGRNL